MASGRSIAAQPPRGSDPTRRALVGEVSSRELRRPTVRRRRGRWLTVGVPGVLGTAFGVSSFLVLGVAALVGGASLLGPLLAGLGIGGLVGGGSAFLLRNRRPAPARRVLSDAEMSDGTRTAFSAMLRATAKERRSIERVRRSKPPAAVRPTLQRAETLLDRIDALAGSPALQSRRGFDADVLVLEGMASRYIPDLVAALEDSLGVLASFDGGRESAAANLTIIDEQLSVLDDRLTRIESDVVSGVSRSLDVQREFLTQHVAEPSRNPLIDP